MWKQLLTHYKSVKLFFFKATYFKLSLKIYCKQNTECFMFKQYLHYKPEIILLFNLIAKKVLFTNSSIYIYL